MVRLWELGRSGRVAEAMELYLPSLPLLRMDTVVKFVQLLKRLQTLACPGMGNDRVRPPRLPLEGSELAQTDAIIENALSADPLAILNL